MFTIAMIERSDGTAEVFRIDKPGGGVGTPVFETIESAQAFVDQSHERDYWSVRGLQGDNAVIWVKSLPSKGIDFVVPEPTADEPLDDGKFARAGSFLMKFRFGNS